MDFHQKFSEPVCKANNSWPQEKCKWIQTTEAVIKINCYHTLEQGAHKNDIWLVLISWWEKFNYLLRDLYWLYWPLTNWLPFLCSPFSKVYQLPRTSFLTFFVSACIKFMLLLITFFLSALKQDVFDWSFVIPAEKSNRIHDILKSFEWFILIRGQSLIELQMSLIKAWKFNPSFNHW